MSGRITFDRRRIKPARALDAEHRALSLSTPHIVQPGETFFGLALGLKRQFGAGSLSAAQLSDQLERFHGNTLRSGESIDLGAFLRGLHLDSRTNPGNSHHPLARSPQRQLKHAYIPEREMAHLADQVSDRLKARHINISPQQLMAHASKESSLDRLAIGKDGELGLTQIKPQLAKSYWPKDGILGFKRFRRELLFNPQINLELNGIIVDALARRHGGRNQGLLAYHLGEKGWKQIAIGGPFSGLQATFSGYVKDINRRERHFEHQHFPPPMVALWRKLSGQARA